MKEKNWLGNGLREGMPFLKTRMILLAWYISIDNGGWMKNMSRNIFDEMAGIAPKNSMKDISEKRLENLHPPARPEEHTELVVNDDFFIDLALTSEFKRFVYKLMSGKAHRGTRDKLNSDLSRKVEQVKLAGEVEKLARGSKADYKGVMKELKEVLKRRKENEGLVKRD